MKIYFSNGLYIYRHYNQLSEAPIKTLLLLLLFSFNAMSFAPQHIWGTGYYQFHDLSGRQGFEGQDGKDAYDMDCEVGIAQVGRNGEDGKNGEAGENGRDALVFYDHFEQLKKIRLDQSPGKGGAGGKGGQGSPGCNGGKPGLNGVDGASGPEGIYGNIYLAPKGTNLKGERTSLLLSLKQLSEDSQTLTRHFWNQKFGATELFHSQSDISNKYFEYDHTDRFKLHFRWIADRAFSNHANTRVAIKLTEKGLEVNSYSGAILVYNITRIEDDFYFDILDAKSEYVLKSLSFGKIRKFGEELTLEVKEKFRPNFAVNTDFIISLYEKNETGGADKFISQFSIPRELIEFHNGIFKLNIGKLNFPPQYKRKNTKLNIHLSIYRKARMQTRVLTLKGIFKI